jgi:hypothetical protein
MYSTIFLHLRLCNSGENSFPGCSWRSDRSQGGDEAGGTGKFQGNNNGVWLMHPIPQ